MKYLNSTDDEVETWRVENQDLKDHVRKLKLMRAKRKGMLATSSSMSVVNTLSFKGWPGKKVRTPINW